MTALHALLIQLYDLIVGAEIDYAKYVFLVWCLHVLLNKILFCSVFL